MWYVRYINTYVGDAMYLKAFKQETIPGAESITINVSNSLWIKLIAHGGKEINEMRNEAPVAITYNSNKLRLNHPLW